MAHAAGAGIQHSSLADLDILLLAGAQVAAQSEDRTVTSPWSGLTDAVAVGERQRQRRRMLDACQLTGLTSRCTLEEFFEPDELGCMGVAQVDLPLPGARPTCLLYHRCRHARQSHHRLFFWRSQPALPDLERSLHCNTVGIHCSARRNLHIRLLCSLKAYLQAAKNKLHLHACCRYLVLIYRNGGEDPVLTRTPSATTHTETGLGWGMYTVKVAAVNANGKAGAPASAGPLTVGRPGKLPAAPSATGGIGTLMLTWQALEEDPDPPRTAFYANVSGRQGIDAATRLETPDVCNPWLQRWMTLTVTHSQIYNAAGTEVVRPGVPLAGASGSGSPQDRFTKTINLPSGEYKVRSMLQHTQHCARRELIGAALRGRSVDQGSPPCHLTTCS